MNESKKEQAVCKSSVELDGAFDFLWSGGSGSLTPEQIELFRQWIKHTDKVLDIMLERQLDSKSD